LILMEIELKDSCERRFEIINFKEFLRKINLLNRG